MPGVDRGVDGDVDLDGSGTVDAIALPSYLDETGGGDGRKSDDDHDDDAADGDRPGHPHLVPEAVHDGWVAIGRAAHQLTDRLAAPASAAAPPGGFEALRGVVIHITRHLVMAPHDAAAAFDRLLPRLRDPIVTPRGTLLLADAHSEQARRDPSQLRALGGRLHLWLSPMPLPVELDLVPWGDWRTMVTLHPDRRFGWTIGPHRRSRWFAAGHAAMDVVIDQLRSVAAPYDAAPCGRSWSTPTRARTA